MGIIAWIILGLLAGLIARAILPGHDSVGIIVTLLIGVVGAIAGGLIAEAVGFDGLGSFFELRTGSSPSPGASCSSPSCGPRGAAAATETP